MRNALAVGFLLLSSCFGLQPAFSEETSNASGAPMPGVHAAPVQSATPQPVPTTVGYPTRHKSKFSELLDDVKDIARDFVNIEKGPDGIHVKAPFVNVDTAPDGVHVKAPLVDVTKPTQPGAQTHVKAPLVDVTTDPSGTAKVKAPFVHVNEGASADQMKAKKQ